MASVKTEDPVVIAVNELISLPVNAPEREVVIKNLMRFMYESKRINKWASLFAGANRHGYFLGTDEDTNNEVVQIVAEAILTELRTITKSSRGLRPGTESAYIFGVGKTAVKTFSESAAHTGISGASGRVRRKRVANRDRAKLAELLGREPTKSELLKFLNDNAVEQRGDKARKQGMVFTADDLGNHTSVSLTPVTDSEVDIFDLGHGGVTGFEEDSDVRIEASDASRALTCQLRSAHPGDDVLLTVAVTWMQLTMEGSSATRRSIARQLRLSDAVVETKLALMFGVLEVMRSARGEIAI